MWERGEARPLARHYGAVVRWLGYDPGRSGDDLPARVHAIRRRLGLTQAELAVRLGLDEGTVADIEIGRRRTSRRVEAAIQIFLAGSAES